MAELQIPDWVPDAVKSIAAVAICTPEIRERLLTDQRMKTVWRTLRGQKVESQAISQLKSWQQLESSGISDKGVTLQDQACAAFFAFAAMEVSSERAVWTREKANKFAEQWNSARDMCSWIMHDPMFEVDFHNAATLMVAGFERHASMLEDGGWLSGQATPAYFLERSRTDDNARARARAVAAETHKIFGSYLCGTVAKVVSVALQVDVREIDVRRWCRQEPELLPTLPVTSGSA
jgi:hypothetical protein